MPLLKALGLLAELERGFSTASDRKGSPFKSSPKLAKPVRPKGP